MTPDNFRSHPVFEKLTQFYSRINEQEAKEKIDIENLYFFQSSFRYISDRLKTTIPILVQEAELSSLNNEIDAGLQQINNFLGNNNIGHINNAVNNFFSALNRVRNLPLPFAKGDYDFSKSIANFEQIVQEKYTSLEDEKNELATEIENLKADLLQKDTEINRLFKLVEAKETDIQSLNTQFQNEFSALKIKANQDIETDRNRFRQEIDSEKKIYRDEIDELKATIDTDTTDLINSLNTKLEEAKKIVNVIGNVGVTGNYQLIANEHKKAANLWRWITIAFMSAFSGLLIWTIIDLSSEGFDWLKSLIRIIAAAALSYPATYAARESTRHRKLETINRTAELELASLSPFIELMPETKQQAIREKLVDKYFGNGSSDTITKTSEDESVSIGGLEKILKAVSSLLNK
ncbi:MAG: hypothetical protein MH132_03705 [Hydrotalea sp.]|nr:hypothetical protein [Hydrotalea sp.]